MAKGKVVLNKYGWKKDKPDPRDVKFMAPKPVALAPSIDLSKWGYPPVQDQGQLGACTAFAIGSAHMYKQMQQKNKKVFMPSHLFIYFNEREMEGTVLQDSGAMIRDGIKSINKQGVCEETVWKYDVARFRVKPPPAAYQDAMYHQSVFYQSVPQTLTSLKQALTFGNPIVFGFKVYEGFESPAVAESGEGQMPAKGERCLGGHAVNICGYDDATQRFKIQNSWGTKWGKNGYFTLPYEYILKPFLSSDFWIIQSVESGH
jgi:C1A family cysteine protease